MDKTDFLGIGWSFPPSFSKDRVEMVEYVKDIRESIKILLTTEKGERIFRPEYGSTLKKWLFSEINLTEQTMIIDEITESILANEPRVQISEIKFLNIDNLEGKILISITYIIRLTNRQDNIVFPFYLKF